MLNFVVDIPFWDEWSLTPLVIKLHSGSFTWLDFWAPHNEHRIPVLRFTLLLLAKIGGWSTSRELFLGLATQLLTGLVLWRLASNSFQSRLLPLLLLISSLLLFSAVQVQIGGAGGGYQLVWYMINLFVVTTFWVLTQWKGRWLGLLAAIFVATLASYSVGNGILLWPLGFLAMLFQRSYWSWRAIGLWFGAAALCLGFYFYGYSAGNTNLLGFLQNPIDFILYILAYIGSPLAMWGGIPVAVSYGSVGLIALLVSIYGLWRRRPIIWANIQPWVWLTLFVILSATLAGLNRLQIGLPQALSSRYTTGTMLFWIGLSVVVFVALRELYHSFEPKSRLISLGLVFLLLIPGTLGYINAYQYGYLSIKNLSGNLEFGHYFIYDYPGAPQQLLESLYPSAESLRQYAWALENYNESFFRVSKTEYHQQLEDKWQARLPLDYYRVFHYPASTIKMTDGFPNTLNYSSSNLSFTSSGLLGGVFYVDATEMSRQRPMDWGGISDSQVLDIQSRKALALIIYWNTGKAENPNEISRLYSLEDNQVDTERHFRVSVPPGVQGFRLDVYYPSAHSVSDTLAIDLYNHK